MQNVILTLATTKRSTNHDVSFWVCTLRDVGIVRGDNQTLYFEMLYEKLHKAELTRIRKQNSLKPGKISKISMLLILAVVGLILTGMILTLMEEFKSNGVL